MSAYIVEDSTINKIVHWLTRREDWDIRQLIQIGYKIGRLCDSSEIERLAKDMFQLNVDSINQCYGEGEAEKFRSLDFQYRLNPHSNEITGLSALACWKYQCTEGDIPETDLFKAMDEVYKNICVTIVQHGKAWQNAKWG